MADSRDYPPQVEGRRQLGLGDGEADGEPRGDPDGDADGEPLGEGELDGDGLGECRGDGDESAAGAAGCGSGGAGGVASDSSTIITSTIAPTAADMASVSDPRDGQRPVLCAELRYARLIGVRWMPSAAAPAHGPLARPPPGTGAATRALRSRSRAP